MEDVFAGEGHGLRFRSPGRQRASLPDGKESLRSAGRMHPAGKVCCLRAVKTMPALRPRPLRPYVSAALFSERERVRGQHTSPADAPRPQISVIPHRHSLLHLLRSPYQLLHQILPHAQIKVEFCLLVRVIDCHAHEKVQFRALFDQKFCKP